MGAQMLTMTTTIKTARAALLVDYSRIWLVVTKILYRFDDQGRLLTTIDLAKKSSVRV